MEASQFICHRASLLRRRKPILCVTCQVCAQESSQSLSFSFLPSDFQKLQEISKTSLDFSLEAISVVITSFYHVNSNIHTPTLILHHLELQIKIRLVYFKCHRHHTLTHTHNDPSNPPASLMGSLVTPP